MALGLAAGLTLSASAASTSQTPEVRSQKSEGRVPTSDLRPPTPGPTNAPIPQSVFLIPKTRAEGVDPFFPRSKRLEFVAPTNQAERPSVMGELVVKGFSGTPASPLVIINDHTFGVGDVGEVTTSQGRVRIRCLEIRLQTESVTVEANHERRELRFRSGK